MSRRHRVIASFLLIGTVLGLPLASAQGAQGSTVLRIGVVVPTFTPGRTVQSSLYDIVGQAAEQGALQAYGDYSSPPDDGGIAVHVYMASAPSADSAVRAANRLLTVDHVRALVGGLVPGEADALSGIAQKAGVPFLNIGSPSMVLRAECRSTTFHIAASAAMYLDALTRWYSGPQEAKSRWFIVYNNDAEGRALRDRAALAVSRIAGAQVVGTSIALPNTADYRSSITHLTTARADVVFALLGAVDQMTFLAQLQSIGPDVAVAAFPDPVSQTRDYLGALNWRASTAGLGDRVALWDTALATPAAAKTLNDRYTGRWGQPMDPTAWAAYEAVNILHQAALKAGSVDPEAMMREMTDPDVAFDVAKGVPVGFRTWNHQLRQPLYVVQLDPKAAWGVELSKQIALAAVAAQLPSAGGITSQTLDEFGNGPATSSCHL